MGWDDQTRGLQSIDKFTYFLETDEERMGWDDQTRGLQSINRFTYFLETDEDNGMG